MLVVTRYRVTDGDLEGFRDRARRALEALTARPGCRDGRVGRSVDDPQLWVLATTWDSVGSYRRALSAYEVKLRAVPLMYSAVDEPSAFEDLVTWTPDDGMRAFPTARSADADRVDLGEAATPLAPRDLS